MQSKYEAKKHLSSTRERKFPSTSSEYCNHAKATNSQKYFQTPSTKKYSGVTFSLQLHRLTPHVLAPNHLDLKLPGLANCKQSGMILLESFLFFQSFSSGLAWLRLNLYYSCVDDTTPAFPNKAIQVTITCEQFAKIDDFL